MASTVQESSSGRCPSIWSSGTERMMAKTSADTAHPSGWRRLLASSRKLADGGDPVSRGVGRVVVHHGAEVTVGGEPDVVELDLVEAEFAGFDGQIEGILPGLPVGGVHPAEALHGAPDAAGLGVVECEFVADRGSDRVLEGDDPRDRVEAPFVWRLRCLPGVVPVGDRPDVAGLLHVGEIGDDALLVLGVEDERVDGRWPRPCAGSR